MRYLPGGGSTGGGGVMLCRPISYTFSDKFHQIKCEMYALSILFYRSVQGAF